MLWILVSPQCTLAHRWPSLQSNSQSLPTWRDQQDPRQCLELVDAARNAQAKLRQQGLSLDDRAMPRERNSTSRKLDVSRVGIRQLRKRQAIWKRPMAEAMMRGEPLFSCAARLSQLEAVENAFQLTANDGTDCVPLDQHKSTIRSPSDATKTVPAPKTTETGRVGGSQVLGSVGRIRPTCSEVPERRRCAKLCDVGCHILHNACCEAGLKAQREVIVLALATEKVTEPRVQVDAWEAPRSSPHSPSLHSRGCGSHPPQSRHDKRRLQRWRKLDEQRQANMDERKAKWRSQETSSASGPTKRYGAQATYKSAIDLHKAATPNICGALHRPLLERQLEVTFALAVKADLPTAAVAVDDHAMVQFECGAGKV